jgi:hypothetical protein
MKKIEKDYNKLNSGIMTTQGEMTPLNLPKFDFEEINYRLTDFDNEFTICQMDCATEIAQEFLSLITENLILIKDNPIMMRIVELQHGREFKDIKDESEKTELLKLYASPEMLMYSLQSVKGDRVKKLYPQVIALFYLPETEKYFNEDTYKDRSKLFANLPAKFYKEVEVILSNFFYLKVPSMWKDSQISTAKMMSIIPK